MAKHDPYSKYTGGMPTAGSGTSGPPKSTAFIGVENDYSLAPTLADWFRPDKAVVDSVGTLGATPNLPRYPEGAETVVRKMSVENVARLQGALSKVGLIGPETRFRVGDPTDRTTMEAYKKLLAVANQKAISDVDALNYLGTVPQARGDGKTLGADGTWTAPGGKAGGEKEDLSGVRSTTQTNEAMFTDPATVRDTLRTAMETRLGRAATAAEEAQFRAALRAEEGGDSVSTTQTVYGRKGNPKSSYTSQADDTTDASAPVMADAFTRQGKLGREANTRMAGTDYYASILSLPGMGS